MELIDWFLDWWPYIVVGFCGMPIFLFVIIALTCLVFFVLLRKRIIGETVEATVRVRNNGEQGDSKGTNYALYTAEECYATGEISIEEYDQLKKDLSDYDIFEEARQEIEIIERTTQPQEIKEPSQKSEPTSAGQDDLRAEPILVRKDDLVMEYEFEQYVLNILCSEGQFSVEQWNTDYYDGVVSRKYPDFIMTFKPAKKKFAVECKYLKDFHIHEEIKEPVLKWTSQKQIDSYCDYSFREGIPVTIVIGVRGKPNEPESIYCIPLEKVKRYPEIYPSVYSNHRRDKVDKKFFFHEEDGFVA